MTTAAVDVFHTADDADKALRRDARQGLTSAPKWLPPKWFYDARGSELFEAITRLEEYYPTRAEREILQRYAGEIASRRADSETSRGTNCRSVPFERRASSSRRVFSEEPEPSSTRVWAALREAIAPA